MGDRYLDPVNPINALRGKRVVDVKHGNDASRVRQPYGIYTLVLEGGEEIVIGQMLGQIQFSQVKE